MYYYIFSLNLSNIYFISYWKMKMRYLGAIHFITKSEPFFHVQQINRANNVYELIWVQCLYQPISCICKLYYIYNIGLYSWTLNFVNNIRPKLILTGCHLIPNLSRSYICLMSLSRLKFDSDIDWKKIKFNKIQLKLDSNVFYISLLVPYMC